MWNIMDIPMIVSKWTPFKEESQPAMKSIPLWVTLTNIPPTMFTDKGLEFLASAVGKPIRLHPKTEACVSFEEAQILVKADLTKELPQKYVFTGEEEGELDSTINYTYPWLPPRCSCCQKWGHLRDTCLSMGNKSPRKHVPESEIKKRTDEIVEQRTEQGSGEEKGDTVGVVSETAVAQLSDPANKTENADGQSWITPSKPGSTSGKKREELKFGEVSILSNSFAALGAEDEADDAQVVTTTERESTDPNKPNNTTTQELVNNQCLEETEDQNELLKGSAGTEKIQGYKPELQLRPSLPRGSKSAHKTVSMPSTQSARVNPKDRSKKVTPKHH
ncbi:unnamed protein product [Arabidopsis arenosa]|uniref:DUF4283 domain-containing protein n=1 Tax=Arabidopsis arenosa TaxID=38785 RepID=A0A8S2AJQ7_ARAAE|nr:unnamed protein product [Arabidopsis arenosa]